MKTTLISLLCLVTFNSFAKPIEVDVLSAHFGVEDHTQRPSLCLTVVRVPSNGALIGVVEGIEDCFYARRAKKAPAHKIELDIKKLKKFSVPELASHLQSLDTQLEFLFSQGE